VPSPEEIEGMLRNSDSSAINSSVVRAMR
jgi:hypothetical protein